MTVLDRPVERAPISKARDWRFLGRSAEVRQQAPAKDWNQPEDFGENLLQTTDDPIRVTVLAADALARAAHALACRVHQGEVPKGHLDLVVPLPKLAQAPAAGTSAKRTFRVFSAERDR